MTRLLVSVRDVAEAKVALEAGVDLIDVKEPSLGSLGAASPRVLQEIAAFVAGRASLSVALGELLEKQGKGPITKELSFSLPGKIDFVKWGLAGCALNRDWPQLWQQALSELPSGVGRVAVVYADTRCASSPRVEEILQWAPRVSCSAVLLDTFDKSAGALLDHWSLEQVARLVDLARGLGMIAVIAGSLVEASLERILPLEPDYVGIRGAACRNSRVGPLCPARLARLVERVRAPSHAESQL